MKNVNSFILLFILLIPFFSFGQVPLFERQAEDVTEVNKRLKSKEKFKQIKKVKLHKEALQNNEMLIDLLDIENVVITKQELISNSGNSFTWHGKIGNNGNGYFTLYDGKLSGKVQYKNKTYLILPHDEGSSFAVELETMTGNEPTPPVPPSRPAEANTLSSGTDCKARILFAYTPAAKSKILSSGYSDLSHYFYDCIASINQSFINSDVYHRVELGAVVRVTDYTERDINSDLSFFTHNSSWTIGGEQDVYMNYIPNLKEKYSSDLGFMVADYSSFVIGLAWMNGNFYPDYAYGVIDADYGTLDVTSHEMGHLHGIEHDQAHANTTPVAPYAYGNRFLGNSGYHTSIMYYSYSSNESVNYWTNPDIYYDGVPTGDATSKDAARTLDETAQLVANMVSTPVDLTLSTAEALTDNEIGNALGKNSITLTTGFEVTVNSEFTGKIDNCSGGFATLRRAMVASLNKPADTESTTEVKIYPNPASSNFFIDFAGTNASIKISDLTGTVIRTIEGFSSHSMIDNKGITTGMYIISIEVDGNQVSTEKLVIR